MRQRGFSLIELLAAAAILGVLASVAVPVIETTMRRERERALRTALRDVREAIDAYKRAADDGRIEVKPGESGYPHTLTELVAGVEQKDKAQPRLYFIRRIPRDPFATDSTVSAIDSWGLRSFQSPPEAPKAGDDVFDIHSRSDQKGLNGVPYQEW
jgi:general secretion pathway protein G